MYIQLKKKIRKVHFGSAGKSENWPAEITISVTCVAYMLRQLPCRGEGVIVGIFAIINLSDLNGTH